MLPVPYRAISYNKYNSHFTATCDAQAVKPGHSATGLQQQFFANHVGCVPKKFRDINRAQRHLALDQDMRKGRNAVVGIATRYGLESPGTESRWGTSFSIPVQTGPGAHPDSYTMGTGSFFDGKAAEALTTHTHRTPRLKKQYSTVMPLTQDNAVDVHSLGTVPEHSRRRSVKNMS